MIVQLARLVAMIIGLALLAPLWSVPLWAGTAEATPLRVGLLPTNATLSLLRLYDPWRRYLERVLERPVQLYTSRNFRSSLDDVRAQDFDLLVTASNFGVIAQDLGYVPLTRYRLELRPLIVTPKGSPIHSAADLAGKKLLSASRLAALSVVAQRWLEVDYHLVAGRDYQLVEAASQGNALRAVALGDGDAAITGVSPLQQAPPEIRAKLDSFPSRLITPHQFTMAHPRLGAETIQRLRSALLNFPLSPEGKVFFAASGFEGNEPLSQADMDAARPYADLVKQLTARRP